MIPEDLKFAKTHEWAKADDETVTIGISEFAVNQLGDIVFLELPAQGDSVSQGAPFGVIESVKAAVDLESPASGEVTEANDALTDQLDNLGEDPYGNSWMIKVKIADTAELDSLMNAADYETYVQSDEVKH